jgi:hypothetical protein
MKAAKLLKSRVALVSALAMLPVLTFAQAPNETNHYLQTNLVTDPNSGLSAPFTDKNLKNPWGMARSTGSRALGNRLVPPRFRRVEQQNPGGQFRKWVDCRL